MITDGTTPLGVLAFLALVGGLLVSGIAFLSALLMKQHEWARRFALAGAAGVALYVILLLGFSLGSQERVLPRGQAKHLCEIDCHSEYAVTGVRKATTVGPRTAQGVFYVVTVKVEFDSSTISSRRGMSPLQIGPREVTVVDGGGARYGLLSPDNADSLRRSIVPGQSYTTELVFDLPTSVSDPKLLIAVPAGPPDWLVIGSENSLLHKRVFLGLGG